MSNRPIVPKRRIGSAGLACAALVVVLAVLSGCGGGPHTELIVMPDASEAPASDAGSFPYQVERIYSLPTTESELTQPIGWSDPDTVVALSASLQTREQLIYGVHTLVPPYAAASEPLRLDDGLRPERLSPDGRYLAATDRDRGDGMAVRVVTLPDGETRTVAELAGSQVRMLGEAGAWSANSRYLAYFLLRNVQGERSVSILLCDVEDGTAAHYPVAGLDNVTSDMTVIPTNDAGAVLFVTESAVRMAVRDGSRYLVAFAPPVEGEGIERAMAEWVNDNQFIYLDENGTLSAYDHRTGETVVLLEKIGRFRLSRDRKAIAYFASGRHAVYAARLQGNNLLYESTVYQGILPTAMDWSPGGKRLLLQGGKRYPLSDRMMHPSTASDTPIVAEGPEDRQQIIVEFQ
ncbi:hypothetical protein IDH44_23020 [Paenibacillus sp. IB182496]|uniref:Uncharacterized protein n=1 Tax=Paenibacillus sabuli TaxID=2772509 RepID=A0A927BZ59_9BACL|nr:hypothetical protein [Paenibacillus sabuli]MBD2848079.1 hypothetical protein [Paenibacillus sabuli]